MKTRLAVLVLAALAVLAAGAFGPPAQAAEAAAPGAGAQPAPPITGAPAGKTYLDTVFEHLDAVHQRVKTLEGRLIQVKSSGLLIEPAVSEGRLLYRAPDEIRWEYGGADATIMVVGQGKLTMYYPGLKKADVVDVGEYQGQIMRATGLGQSSQTLRENFRIELAGRYLPGQPGASALLPEELALASACPAPAAALAVLDLDPAKRRIERRVERVRLWISEENWLPAMIRLVEVSGDSTLLVFRSLTENAELPAGAFELALPPDVQVNYRSRSGPQGERE